MLLEKESSLKQLSWNLCW